MTQQPLNSGKCPSCGELSAWFDHESANPERIRKHLEKCPACREYIASIEQLERSIRQVIAAKTGEDEEIAERMLVRVKAAIMTESGESPRISPVSWFARAAAIVLLTAAAGYMTIQAFKTDTDSGASVAAYGKSPVSSVPHAVQLSDLTTVSFNADGSALPVSGEKKAPVINDFVRQVWNIPAGVDVQTTVESLLRSAGIQEYSLSKSVTGWNVGFQSDKLNTVMFVRGCAHAGLHLLSPDQPQPEQNVFAGKANERVFYSAAFVSR